MPGDLNLKKSWHPGLIKNQKKIWIEEQNKLNEFKKIQQVNEELKQEREKLQLMKIQYGEDLSNLPAEEKLKLNKLNWMYDDPSAKNEAGFNEVNEEFLLGKKNVENLLNNNQAFNVEESARLDKIINIGKNDKGKGLNLEDPLTRIRNEQLKKMQGNRHQEDERVKERHRSRDRERNYSLKDQNYGTGERKSRSSDKVHASTDGHRGSEEREHHRHRHRRHHRDHRRDSKSSHSKDTSGSSSTNRHSHDQSHHRSRDRSPTRHRESDDKASRYRESRHISSPGATNLNDRDIPTKHGSSSFDSTIQIESFDSYKKRIK